MISMKDIDRANGSERFAIIKGFIDARDESGSPLYGVFMSIGDEHSLLYLKSYFSAEAINKDMSYAEAMGFIDANETKMQDGMMRYVDAMRDFGQVSRSFEVGNSPKNPRELEHKLSYHCTDVMGINAIVFIELLEADKGTIAGLVPQFEFDKPKTSEAHDEGTNASSIDGGSSDIFLACNPVLDTTGGTAAGSLAEGDHILAELPRDSLYYRFLRERDPNFSGALVAEVTGVHIDEFGAAVVALKIADGVNGTIRLSESVRLRRADPRRESSQFALRPELILAGASILIFILGVMLVLKSF